ncbi:hypothetical protein ACTMU2_40750 [Cupriavidus basilensis]
MTLEIPSLLPLASAPELFDSGVGPRGTDRSGWAIRPTPGSTDHSMHEALLAICDPDAVDRQAKSGSSRPDRALRRPRCGPYARLVHIHPRDGSEDQVA